MQKTNNNYLQGILNNFWIVPAIVKGCHDRIWEDYQFLKYPYIAEIWEREKLMCKDHQANKYILTKFGEEIVECQNLFHYNLSIVQDQTVGYEHETKTDPGNYEVLRKGLAKYTRTFMQPLISQIAGDDYLLSISKEKQLGFLDYCGGSGEYLKMLLKHFPDAVGYLVDKAASNDLRGSVVSKKINFKEKPLWFFKEFGENPDNAHYRRFDVIFLNEILHCVNWAERYYLLNSAKRLLTENGMLIIGENIPSPEFQWRMKTFTDNGSCIDYSKMESLLTEQNLNYEKFWMNDTHYFYKATKK